ncbi:MAG TPA: hypothetical protein VK966_05345 [Longimicrobiales bacterium]|nr:hypothetical protein [Longimicrobiales bacterium]
MKPTGAGLFGLTVAILGLALVGGGLVAYLWETLNQLMAGFVDWSRLLISIPVLAVFLLLLRFIAGRVERWQGEPGNPPEPDH